MAHILGRTHKFLHHVGEKVKGAVKLAGEMHGIYQVGKTIYQGLQAAAPLAAAVL